MDTILLVIVIGIMVGMVVLMFGYAGFIHQGPSQGSKDERPGNDEDDPPAKDDK